MNKIQAHHLERQAFVYIRQSTTTQVLENTESTARQYALADRARALGWADGAIHVIDEDLGKSGATTTDRSGFSRVAEAVAHGRAGAIFTLEVSRLARSSQDWQRLLALCSVARVVVADEYTVYDPRNGDDKLLLDIKGTMSEAELNWLRLRLHGARERKALRGELRMLLPTGYVWTHEGITPDPDEAVRGAITMLIERFAIEPTIHAVLRWARREGFKIPTRRNFTDGTSEVTWSLPNAPRVKEVLRNPVYAGAYAYGRRCEETVLRDGEIVVVCRTKALNEWKVLIRDAHPGLVSWETYMKNQDKLADNAPRKGRGAPREGHALCTGLLICGRCGRRMRTTYPGPAGDRWTYICYGDQSHGSQHCWLVSGRAVDRAVEECFLGAVATDELEVTLAVEREADVRAASLHDQWKLRLERADFEARRAERRYKAVEPENRVVARTLEREWEERLQDVEAVRRDFESARREHRVQLTERDRARIRALASDLPSVWRAPTTSRADQKAMLRIAIEAITIQPIDVPARQTHIRMQWKGGAIDEMTIARPTAADETRTLPEWEERVVALVGEGLGDKAIAARMATEFADASEQTNWTTEKIKRIRLRRKLKRAQSEAPKISPLPDRHPDGRYSVAAAARRLGVSGSTIRSRIARGLLRASQEDFGWKRGAIWVDLDGDGP